MMHNAIPIDKVDRQLNGIAIVYAGLFWRSDDFTRKVGRNTNPKFPGYPDFSTGVPIVSVPKGFGTQPGAFADSNGKPEFSTTAMGNRPVWETRKCSQNISRRIFLRNSAGTFFRERGNRALVIVF